MGAAFTCLFLQVQANVEKSRQHFKTKQLENDSVTSTEGDGKQELDSAFLFFLLSHMLHSNFSSCPTAGDVLGVLDNVAVLHEQAKENGHNLSRIVNVFTGLVWLVQHPSILHKTPELERLAKHFPAFFGIFNEPNMSNLLQELKRIVANPARDANLNDFIALAEKGILSIRKQSGKSKLRSSGHKN